MLYYGADYYPEQETWEDIQKDIALMVQAGFNAVRMGEFAWCVMEVEDGKFDFKWLDEIVNALGENGIYSLICTPTACPPVWMAEKHPNILYMDNQGITRPFGGRRHYCYNNPTYREYSRRIAAALAKRYGNNPYVLGFHIDNELAQEGTGRCQCDVCKNKFHQWLERKYGTIDNFNRTIGATFWSQTYQRFDQVNMPSKTIEPTSQDRVNCYYDNPALRLDFERFCSDSLIAYQNEQASAIKKLSAKPVTTNTTGVWTNGLNYYEGFETLDIVAVDEYMPVRTNEMYGSSFGCAFIRGIKNKNFWVVETTSGGGHGVWAKQGTLQPYPGTLTQNALYAFASGAELLTYFQFRTFRYGAEQLEAAVMDIDGIPRRRFKEFQTVSALIKQWTPHLEKSAIKNEVAICFDYDTLWGINIKPFHASFNYQSYCITWYRLLTQAGLRVDVIPYSDAVNKYKFVIVPTPVIMGDTFKETLKDYVRGGGILLTTFLAAIRDKDHAAPRVSPPAGLTELFGARVGEGEPVFSHSAATIELQFGPLDGKACKGANQFWTESLEPLGAQIIGRYADTYREGEPVITQNNYGKGMAYYMGAGLEDTLCRELIENIVQVHSLKRLPFTLLPGVEIVPREANDGKTAYYIFNFNERAVTLKLDKQYKNLFSGADVGPEFEMAAKGIIAVV